MLSSVFAKTLRDSRAGILWWGVGIGVLGLTVGLLYPLMLDKTAALQEYMQSLPEWMFALFGLGQSGDFATLAGWADLEFLAWLPLLLAVATIIAGAGALAGEEDRHTLDVLMSQPIARWRVAAEKFAAMAVAVLVVTLIAALLFAVGLATVGLEFDWGRALLATFNAVPVALAMGAIALCGSALLPTRGLAGAMAGVILAVSFFLNSFGRVIDGLRGARQLSLLYYYDSSKPLLGRINWGDIALLLVVAGVFWLAAMWAFERRDLRVG